MTVASIYRKVTAQQVVQGVETAIGAENVDFAGHKLPRMVWVPTTDPFRPGFIRTGLDGAQLNALTQKPFYTRIANVNVHLWSKSEVQQATEVDEIEALEELLRKVLVAVRDTVPGNFTALSFAHGGGRQEGQEIAEYGRYGVLSLSFEIPIYRKAVEEAYTTKTITDVVQTGTIAGETGSPGP